MSFAAGRRPPRSGHALMELVVALPILAIGGAAVTGMVLSSASLLLESERRFEAAARGVELLDSLGAEAGSGPAEGAFEVLGQEVEWDWDGWSTLELRGVGASRGLGHGWNWTLRSGGWSAPGDSDA